MLVSIILFPLIFTIRVSFSGWDVAQPGLDWIGGMNYARMAADIRFWEAMGRLALLTLVSVALEYGLGLALALLLWRDVRAQRFFRVLFLVPMMTTPVIMSVIWRTVFHESLGPANDMLQFFGFAPRPWLTDGTMAMISIVIVEVWQWTSFMFLLLLAGLLSLPREPFLAAAIDGAGPIRTFCRVTFPMLAPISIGALMIRLIEASKLMETVYAMTSGGPGTSTETPSYYIFIRGLREFQIGYAASLSLIYLVVMTISLTLIARFLARAMLPKDRTA